MQLPGSSAIGPAQLLVGSMALRGGHVAATAAVAFTTSSSLRPSCGVLSAAATATHRRFLLRTAMATSFVSLPTTSTVCSSPVRNTIQVNRYYKMTTSCRNLCLQTAGIGSEIMSLSPKMCALPVENLHDACGAHIIAAESNAPKQFLSRSLPGSTHWRITSSRGSRCSTVRANSSDAAPISGSQVAETSMLKNAAGVALAGSESGELGSGAESSTVSGDGGSGARAGGGAVRAFRKRLRIADIHGGDDGGLSRVGSDIVLRGWVRTVRSQKTFSFIELNDGSSLSGLQVVITADDEGYNEIEEGTVTTGASISVEGEIVASKGSKQKIEVRAKKMTLVGKSEGSAYPLQKKRHSLEYLRTIAHLRPRTNTIGAVSRVRSALAFATHKFFAENGFVWVASPIITAADCEGAGDQFCVTTLLPSGSETSSPSVIPASKDGSIDWSQDFFGKPAFLTVSGQLNAEIYASALHDVYTFGPTFRAENSNTSRHLAEFWMIEPELAFADLADDMACATAFLKYVVKHVLVNCVEDMQFFDKFVEPGIIARLQAVVENEFAHVTYTEAVDILKKAKKKKFEFPVEWGADLQSEHERYLTEVVFGGRPLIVTDYPKEIKAFYMRQNDDGKTVAAMDLLVPKVGELIGGSQREERLEVLEARLDELGLSRDAFWWYLDLRRFGSVPHAGFGLGFERLVQFATGVENIRDVIPFPRTPGSADF